MLRILLVSLGLALTAAVGAADEGAERSSEVRAAHARGDAEALARLARSDEPDPWLVVDALLARDARAAAAAFAGATPRGDTAGLASYVEQSAETAASAAWRVAFDRTTPLFARGAWSDALAILDAARPRGPHVSACRLRRRQALCLAALGRPLEAGAAFDALARQAHGMGWLALAAQALSHAGLCHVRAERWSAAVGILDRLIALERERANAIGIADAFLRLGFAYEGRGDGMLAIESLEQARTLAARAGDAAIEARAWSTLGRLYHTQAGDLVQARSALEEAARRLEAVGDHATLAHTLIELGLVHKQRGDLERAAAAQDRAYALMQTLRDKPGMAVALSGLGGVCIRRGEYTRALVCLDEARGLMQSLGNRRGEAVVLSQLGELYTVLSDGAAAERCFTQSFSIAAEIGDSSTMVRTAPHLGTSTAGRDPEGSAIRLLEQALGCLPDGCDREACASILRRIGSLHLVEGEVGAALTRQEDALSAARASGDPMQVSASLLDLAAVHRRMGTLDGALELDNRAVALAEQSNSYEVTARALGSRAATHLARGEAAAAIEDARRAAREATLVYTRLPEFEGSRAGDLWRGLFEVGIEASLRLGRVRDAAWFLEAGRAGLLLSSLGGRDALNAHVVPPALRAEEERARAAEASALAAYRRAYRSLQLDELRARRRDLQAARGAVGRVVRRIRREARHAAQLVCPDPDEIETLQARLEPEEVLLLFALLPRRVLALVVTTADARIVDLGTRPSIEAAVAAVQPDDPEHDATAALATLRERLIVPLELPPHVRRVLVSPMGSLGLVAPALLLPEVAVAYVPSGTTYGLLWESRNLRGVGVLALGDPTYRSTGRAQPGMPCPAAGRGLARLPATRTEALAVGAVTLLGAQATVSQFTIALGSRARWRSVHLACHGIVHPGAPAASSLALSPDENHDGRLRALDLLDLRIHADLVVLSACDTARGDVYDVEGVVGLARAFMFAGAPRVLCSLWKVDDDATRALMVTFYDLWLGASNLTAAEALRAAQRHVASHEKWRHPYYWAAWVLWGLP